jgi:glycosyltransferase involved in cell wall biosynthesis
MRVAFYAPLKPPDHPIPSGDRLVARLLVEALRRAGHEVFLASRLRSRDLGDDRRQARLEALGDRLARRFVERVRPAPDLWFTYHLYDKAPDWIGPTVAAALGIPYVVAEGSVAASRAGGAWARGQAAVAKALRRADLVVQLNSVDEAGVAAIRAEVPLLRLRPFLDPGALPAMARQPARAALAARLGLDPAPPWLIAVAMMRPGDKLASYRVLGAALSRLMERPWRLLVVGDGRAAGEVAAALDPLGDRVARLGALGPCALTEALAAADLCVWPAINEAFGMALLEAQAAGLPVVAGRTGGVPDIVEDGATGLLVPIGDAAAFAASVAALLDDPARRRAMGEAARRCVAERHSVEGAAAALGTALAGLARRSVR